MSKICVKVNAKINLSLNVTGVSNNGYHYLDMVIASVNIADAIALSERSDREITCRMAYGDIRKGGEEINGTDNTAVRAARILMRQFGTSGFDIDITKNIPLSGGLGGSSADASGVIKAVANLYGLSLNSPEMIAVASECGSDVLLQLTDGYKRVTGKGERIENLIGIPEYDVVIAKGAGGVNSRDSYRRFDECNSYIRFDQCKNECNSYRHSDGCKNEKNAGDNGLLIEALRERNFAEIDKHMYNSLYIPSAQLNPRITQTMERLKATGARAVLMSGSGSACFGLYENGVDAQSGAEKLSDFEYVKCAKTVTPD